MLQSNHNKIDHKNNKFLLLYVNGVKFCHQTTFSPALKASTYLWDERKIAILIYSFLCTHIINGSLQKTVYSSQFLSLSLAVATIKCFERYDIMLSIYELSKNERYLSHSLLVALKSVQLPATSSIRTCLHLLLFLFLIANIREQVKWVFGNM